MFQLISLVVAVAVGLSFGDYVIPAGIHAGVYSYGDSVSGGTFYSDATSVATFVGVARVGYNGLWRLYSSNTYIESGSWQYVAYYGSGQGAEHYCYASVVYTNSSVRLTGNSDVRSYAYTRVDVRLSTVQFDGSEYYIYDWSNASISLSNMQLKGSFIRVNWLNQFTLQGAALTLTSSNIQLGQLNQFDLQGATTTITSSSITTGQGCQYLMAPKSTLLADNLDVKMADYSAFEMAAGSNLIATGYSSSISLGERAKLQINGNCSFSGDLIVPDLMIRVVNSTTGDAGFICFSNKLALQLFVSKSA